MDFMDLMPNYTLEDIMRLNDDVFIYESHTFENKVYNNSFFDELLGIVKLKSYTDSIGNTICAFLNTRDCVIRIECKENEDAVVIENRLKELYKRFNYNPEEWISVKQSEKSRYVFLLVEPKDEKVKVYEFDGKIYYRDKGNNRILKDGDVKMIVMNKRKAIGLPYFIDYVPSNLDKKDDFEDTKRTNNILYYRIGVLPDNRLTFYKYMTLDTALTIFRKESNPIRMEELKNQGKSNPLQTMRFVEPSGWDDQYERRFYTADYSKVNKDSDNIPLLFATCFTTQKESEPAWQVYTRGKDGLGERCVQFFINQDALRIELVKRMRDCTIVEGKVRYLSTDEIGQYHLSKMEDGKRNESFLKTYSNFTLENYINLLLLKRTAFFYEQEVRILIIDNNDKNNRKADKKKEAKHKDVSLDWLSFLEGIKVDPKCSDIEIKLLQDEINSLINECGKSEEEKVDLRKKLVVTKYDVNKVEDSKQRLKIGETYKQYEKRLLANAKKP